MYNFDDSDLKYAYRFFYVVAFCFGIWFNGFVTAFL